MSFVLPFRMLLWIRTSCLCLGDNPGVSCECLFPWRLKRSCSHGLPGCNFTGDPLQVFQACLCPEGFAQMSHEYFFSRRAATFQWEGYRCPSAAEGAQTFVFGLWHSPTTARPYRSLREKEAPTCAGSSPHLCLITLVSAGPVPCTLCYSVDAVVCD